MKVLPFLLFSTMLVFGLNGGRSPHRPQNNNKKKTSVYKPEDRPPLPYGEEKEILKFLRESSTKNKRPLKPIILSKKTQGTKIPSRSPQAYSNSNATTDDYYQENQPVNNQTTPQSDANTEFWKWVFDPEDNKQNHTGNVPTPHNLQQQPNPHYPYYTPQSEQPHNYPQHTQSQSSSNLDLQLLNNYLQNGTISLDPLDF